MSNNRLHPVSAEDAIRVFKAVGGKVLPRKKGTRHQKIDREDWLRPVVIPVHKGRDVSVGVLRGNIKTAGRSPGARVFRPALGARVFRPALGARVF